MKLLDKKTISNDLAKQKKLQIDEGIKLATKVDVLRETSVKEAGNLERFRKETIAAVQVEIDVEIRKRDTLKDEIKILEEKKRVAQIPLDAEWAKVQEEQIKLLKDKQVWGEKSDILKEREEEIIRAEQIVEGEKQRADDLNRRASENFARSENTLKDAHENAADMRNTAQAVLSGAEYREIVVEKKEKNLEVREEEVAEVWQKVRLKETDLANRERTLKDKYETLERTIKRLGIKNG